MKIFKVKLQAVLGKHLVITGIILLISSFSYSQTCENLATVTETICDMTIIGDDSMGNFNGVLDLYEVVENFYTLTNFEKPGDIWVDEGSKNALAALDTLTGQLNIWELRESSTTNDDYIFRLKNDGENCNRRVEVRIVLGPYASTGIGTPAAPYFVCDRESTCVVDPLVDINLFTALAATKTTPPAHTNGVWTLLSAPAGIPALLAGSSFATTIPYTPGDNLADSETFSFRYEVPGIGTCVTDVTELTISVLRQPFSGYPSAISICEEDVATLWNNPIDLRDDRYLADEDVEGVWIVDGEQITDQFDSEVNIAEAFLEYRTNVNTDPRFDCYTLEYRYRVQSRSPACSDSTAVVSFTIFESLRDFVQTDLVKIVCPATETRTQINLWNEITFQDDFVYNGEGVSWLFLNGPMGGGDLNIQENFNNAEPDERYLGTVDIENAVPGIYEFEYLVNTPAPCTTTLVYPYDVCNPIPAGTNPCNEVSTTIVVEILDYDYAGEDTSDLKLCVTDNNGEVDLRSLLGRDSRTIDEGVWTDQSNAVVPNIFAFPQEVTAPIDYRLTHTTTNASGCSDTAILEFTLYNLPNAGENVVHEVCSNDRTVTLFDVLGGTPDQTGEWFGPFGYISDGDHRGEFIEGDDMLPILGPGEYVYSVPGNDGCLQSDQATVTIVIIDPAEVGEDVNASYCKVEGRVNLFSLLNEGTVLTGSFEDTSDTDALTPEGVVEFQSLESGIYTFEYVVNNELPCEKSSLNINIQIIDLPEPIIEDQEFCILDGRRLDDIDVEVLNYNWYNTIESDTPIVDNPLLFDDEIYYIASVDADGCESDRVAVNITILNTGEKSSSGELCTLDFQDGVSPNGDNQNDTFDLTRDGLFNIPESFPDFELKIYNRYGSLVYEADIDTEEFRGTSNTSVRLGDDLPSGTYFYVFTPNFNNNTPIQGSFYLSR